MEQKEPVVIAKILSSLPEKFDNVAWYAIPQALQTLDKLNEHLVNEEALLDMRKENATASSNQEVYHAGGKRNYGKGSKEPRASQANDNVKRGNCHYCKKPGHWARDCWKKKANVEKKTSCKNHSLMTEGASCSEDNENAERFKYRKF